MLRALVMSDADALALERQTSPSAPATPASITVRALALGGRPFQLRGGTSDARVFVETFQGLYHLPPIDLPDDAAIIDLGSNIGTTASDFAARYPKARIMCVEMDPESAQLCRMNTEWFEHRRSVVEGAAWVEDARVKYGGTDFWSRRVRWIWDLDHPMAEPEMRPVQAIGIHGLVERAMVELRPVRAVIDYVKMDVEGSEATIFEGDVSWLRHVEAIRVHVHPPVTVDRIISRLTTGGMIATRCWKHRASVTALSPAAAARRPRFPEPASRLTPPPAHI